ncbi:uncharacterized protein CLUP02_13747 [Colletotrichum lupini]|uniref:Uncharacterized protein n=1 Tax=Colletotrichum lupini TaxID=145971 RepID=A0A9Q8WLY9_9PEZI|nr:uncharacterized protein CLUP02_13747 [Colletotrichum lupini]UQC88224.1 hypothetical protein CLUP02_13747 [Colletotrichum lupini]
MCHLSVVNSLMLLLSISYLFLVNCTQQETSNTPPLDFSKTRTNRHGELVIQSVFNRHPHVLDPVRINLGNGRFSERRRASVLPLGDIPPAADVAVFRVAFQSFVIWIPVTLRAITIARKALLLFVKKLSQSKLENKITSSHDVLPLQYWYPNSMWKYPQQSFEFSVAKALVFNVVTWRTQFYTGLDRKLTMVPACLPQEHISILEGRTFEVSRTVCYDLSRKLQQAQTLDFPQGLEARWLQAIVVALHSIEGKQIDTTHALQRDTDATE